MDIEDKKRVKNKSRILISFWERSEIKIAKHDSLYLYEIVRASLIFVDRQFQSDISHKANQDRITKLVLNRVNFLLKTNFILGSENCQDIKSFSSTNFELKPLDGLKRDLLKI